MIFEQFWTDTITEARKKPLEATCEQIADPQPYRTFRVTYRSLGGVRVSARLGVPILAAEQHVPAIITAPGYGGREHGVTLSECQRGYLILQIYPRGQGDSAEAPAGDTSVGFLLRGLDDPSQYYYRGAFMDMLRGVDYLLSREDVDPARLGAMGTSQGGGLVLCAGALEPRIRAVVAHVPFFCDVAHNPTLFEQSLLAPDALRTFAFFDPVHHAPHLSAATLLSSGGQDAICPPETIRAVFDRLPGVKALYHDPALIHTSSGDFYRMSWEWMDRHL